MEKIRVVMVCKQLDKNTVKNLIKAYPIPEGFYVRNYMIGEEDIWAKIETSAGEFQTEEKALQHFHQEFGQYRDEMEKRCFFVIDKEDGIPIGTTTAWYNNNFKGERYGRIHWVGICSGYQGRKLAKPLLARALACLSNYHNKAYLTSQTTSYKAINMYLDFGFIPEMVSNDCERAWKILEGTLNRNIV